MGQPVTELTLPVQVAGAAGADGGADSVRAARAPSRKVIVRRSRTCRLAPPPGRRCERGCCAANDAMRSCRWASWRWPSARPARRVIVIAGPLAGL